MVGKGQIQALSLFVGIIISCQFAASLDAKTNLSSPASATSISPVLLEAQALARAAKLADARKLTAAYLQKNPSSLEGLAFQATLDEALANFARAREDYKRLLVLAPDVWQARLGLARANLKLSEYKAAVQDLTQLSQSHPDQPKVWLNLALAKLETGDLDDAESAARKAILFDPASIAPVKLLADIKFQSTQVSFARELGLAILQREPSNLENYKFLLKCMAYIKSDPEDLNNIIDLALEKLPTPALFYELGRQGEMHARAIKAGKSEKLIRRKNSWYLVSARAFDLACLKDTSNAKYHLELARVLAVLKMKQHALVEAEKASRLNPSLKYGPQLDAAVAAARRDIAGRIKISLSGQRQGI